MKSLFDSLRQWLDRCEPSKLSAAAAGVQSQPSLNACAMTIVEMKHLTRDTQSLIDSLRTQNDERRDRLASVVLATQNLSYEKSVLQNEIRHTQQLRDQHHRNFDFLISEEQFLRDAPQQLTASPSMTSHQKMLNRLAFELEQRKQYE
jgi:hypothetical protein